MKLKLLKVGEVAKLSQVVETCLAQTGDPIAGRRGYPGNVLAAFNPQAAVCLANIEQASYEWKSVNAPMPVLVI
jgi:hypothetical protein